MFACEGFPPMVQLARRIVAAQPGAAEPRVSVLAKRSDELTCAPSRCYLKVMNLHTLAKVCTGYNRAAVMKPCGSTHGQGAV